jgi:acyl-coenzyme A thioesterase PaaI-like protein
VTSNQGSSPNIEWNLPDDVEHPAWRAKRALARSMRELCDLVVTTEASPEALDQARRAIDAQRAALEAAPQKTNREAFRDGSFFAEPSRYKDRTAMIGHSNPIAQPLRMRVEGEGEGEGALLVGEITCGHGYGGAPGLVHGGLVAAFLDEILGHVGIRLGAGLVTSTLEIRYLKPTPLEVPLRVEGWLVGHEGRRYQTAGQVVADGVVTAKAKGTFVDVRGERFQKLFEELGG